MLKMQKGPHCKCIQMQKRPHSQKTQNRNVDSFFFFETIFILSSFLKGTEFFLHSLEYRTLDWQLISLSSGLLVFLASVIFIE